MSHSNPNTSHVFHTNPATAALLQTQLEQQNSLQQRRESDSSSKLQPHVAQWAKIIDGPIGAESGDVASVVSSVASCLPTKRASITHVTAVDKDESDSSYDSSDSDESIDVSEDEEETRVAQALVRASYNGLSSAAIDRLIGTSSALKRKDRNVSMPEIKDFASGRKVNQLPQVKCQQRLQEPADKKLRVTIHETQNSIHRINSDYSARGNLQPSASRAIPMSRSTVMLTPGSLVPTHLNRTLNGSESSPALRIVGNVTRPTLRSPVKLSAVAQSMPLKAPTAVVRRYVKPDEKLRTILADAKMKEPQQMPFSSLVNFFTEITPEAVAAYDIPIVQALRSENIEELRRMKDAKKPMLCGNKFGETIMHAAARRRSAKVVEFLLKECNVTPRVCCDSGRTPLHDACWTVDTNFDVVDLLLDACPDLLYITDKRGFTPMSYVREELWEQWCSYLDKRGASKLVANELF
jgi:Ankyrin repeats (3 copies)